MRTRKINERNPKQAQVTDVLVEARLPMSCEPGKIQKRASYPGTPPEHRPEHRHMLISYILLEVVSIVGRI